LILYEYECSECEHNFEIQQSIKANVKRKCPQCGKNSLERIVFGGLTSFVKGDATTIGQLAERNFNKNKSRIREKEARELELNPPPKKEWWEADKGTNKKIAKMNADQKRKYIMEGD